MDLLHHYAPVYVPFTAPGPEVATRVALLRDNPIYVELRGETAYPRLLGELWKRREGFIVVEQDVVPWPGAIDQLQDCPEPWCAFAYDQRYDMEAGAPGDAVFLGCSKLGTALIDATPYVWSDWPSAHWASCDTRISTIARASGMNVHQHRPAVVNANPKLLEAVEFDSYTFKTSVRE